MIAGEAKPGGWAKFILRPYTIHAFGQTLNMGDAESEVGPVTCRHAAGAEFEVEIRGEKTTTMSERLGFVGIYAAPAAASGPRRYIHLVPDLKGRLVVTSAHQKEIIRMPGQATTVSAFPAPAEKPELP